MALRAALTLPDSQLAGCIALSCYLPGRQGDYDNLVQDKLDTPVLQAHGDQDGVVSYKRGQLTAEVLQTLVKDHKFITYEGMMHEATMEELEDIKAWIKQKLNRS